MRDITRQTDDFVVHEARLLDAKRYERMDAVMPGRRLSTGRVSPTGVTALSHPTVRKSARASS